MGNPTFTPLVEAFHEGGFIVSEANGHLSRDDIVLASGAKYLAGTVLGQQTIGAETTTHPANTGNGVMGTVTLGANVEVGAYNVQITKAAANAGDFEVINPAGDLIGVGTVGIAFNEGGISFTLADGSADFVVGDKFTLTVAPGTGKFVNYNPTNTDGSQVPAAILYGTRDATSVVKHACGIMRDCEVNGSELIWDASVNSSPLLAAGIAALKTLGIVVR